jgi:glycosyltransferase involved in cell wall biosynthesis
MKVAHLTTVDSTLRYLLLAQLRAARNAGHEVIAISAPGPYVADLEREGITHRALPSSTRSMRPFADVRAALGLWRILHDEQPDVLHTHNPKPGVYGRVVGRLARVPTVVNTVHGLYATPEDRLVKRLGVYTLEAVAARFADAELVQNPEDLALMNRLRIAPRGRARLLGNGVDLTHYDRARISAARRKAIRTELGATDETIVVGSVGRLVAEKGFPELFGAAHQLDARFLTAVIGPEDPSKADHLTAEELERARAAGVVLLGHRDDLDVLYAAMDVFVLASHREGFPRAAMEAAAMSLPIVATDIRGSRQVVDHDMNGLLVPVGAPGALARAIRRLGDEPDTRARMGHASRARARAEFDEERVVRIVLETYTTAHARRSAARLCQDSGGAAHSRSYPCERPRAGRRRATDPRR